MSCANEGTLVPEKGHLSRSPGERLGAFLRQRHPFKTAIAVEAESGVSAECVKKLLARGSMPSLASFGRLLSAYGPALLAAVMDDQPQWLVEAADRARCAADERG